MQETKVHCNGDYVGSEQSPFLTFEMIDSMVYREFMNLTKINEFRQK